MKLKTINCDRTWRYYCYYCDQDITPPDGALMNGWVDCEQCDVRFIMSGSVHAPDIFYVQLSGHQHMIELNIADSKTYLFNHKASQMLTLNHVIDINPDTYMDWLYRLLKLQAFS